VSRHQSFIYLFYNNIVFPLWFISFGWDHASLKKILKITSPKFFKGFPCHFLQKNYQILNYLHLHGMSISRRLNHFLFIRCPTLLVKNSQIIFHKFKAVFGHTYIGLDTFTFTSFLFGSSSSASRLLHTLVFVMPLAFFDVVSTTSCNYA